MICRADITIGGKPLLAYLGDLHAKIVDWSLEGEAKYMFRVDRPSISQTSVETTIHGDAIDGV